MLDVFLQISIILLIVLAVSFIMRLLKQPLIIGYILSGILIGPFFLNFVSYNQTLSVFSHLGIAFLLFIVGLHLNPRVIKEVGKISFITGVGQVFFTSIIGYFIAIFLGFNKITSLYVAVALTFSSTIIIMKLLSDKDAIDKLYGKISIGFLLVQDFIAIIILIIVSSFLNAPYAMNIIILTLLKGVVITGFLAPFSYYVIPRLDYFFARSQEFLFLFAIAFGLGLASLFYYLGFSIEVGALIAGVILSMSPYNYEISSKLRPLRDFFIISFFILLGSQMVFEETANLIVPALIFSLFVLIGNPLIVMILMGLFGYSKNTGFMAGLTVAQISEFSLIMIALGIKVGHLSDQALSFVTIIGLITIAGSTYLIMYAEKIYHYISRFLTIFEGKNIKKDGFVNKDYDAVLLGENRMGFAVMNSFIKMKTNYLVVDFNPERVKILLNKGIPCIYGDISDVEFLDSIKISKAKLIVSTISDIETNMTLLSKICEKNKKAVLVVAASNIFEALQLYKAGADYVILPHFIGGSYTASLIENARFNKNKYKLEKNNQIKELKKRLSYGHYKSELGERFLNSLF